MDNKQVPYLNMLNLNIFSCQICLKKPSLIPSPTIPPFSSTMTDLLNTLPFLIKDISTRLDQQDISLRNISSQLKHNKSNHTYSTIIPPTATSSIPLPPPPHHLLPYLVSLNYQSICIIDQPLIHLFIDRILIKLPIYIILNLYIHTSLLVTILLLSNI